MRGHASSLGNGQLVERAAARRRGRAWAGARGRRARSPSPRCRGRPDATRPSTRIRRRPRNRRRTRCGAASRGTGLRGLAVPAAVETDLGEEERPVARDVLQARQVRLQARARLQVHVEADEVEEGKLQVLGRRIVHVRDEASRIDVLHGLVERFQESLHAVPAMPAHDGGRDLVADGVAKERGVTGAHARARSHAIEDGEGPPGVVQKGDVLFPRHAHQHGEAVGLGGVEQIGRGHGVGANCVEAVGRHQGEVPGQAFPRWVFPAARVGAKRTIRHAAHPELGVAQSQELSCHSGSRCHDIPRRGRRWIQGAWVVVGARCSRFRSPHVELTA